MLIGRGATTKYNLHACGHNQVPTLIASTMGPFHAHVGIAPAAVVVGVVFQALVLRTYGYNAALTMKESDCEGLTSDGRRAEKRGPACGTS